MALSITELRKGTLVTWEGQPYRVVDYKQKVMGRGGSIVNVRIKSLVDGKVLDKTFKGNEQLEPADVTSRPVQYLYNDGQNYFFMNESSFEQFEVPTKLVEGAGNFLKEGDTLQLLFFNVRPISADLPKHVALKVTYAED